MPLTIDDVGFVLARPHTFCNVKHLVSLKYICLIDASNVVARKTVKLGEVEVNVAWFTNDSKKSQTTQESAKAVREESAKAELKQRRVLVSGLPVGATREFVELVLENKEKYGGGPLEEVDINSEENTAHVVFQKAEGDCFDNN